MTTRVWTEARASSRGCIATHGLVATARAHHRLCPVFRGRLPSLPSELVLSPMLGFHRATRSKGTVQSICSELVTSSYRYGASRYVERDAYFEDSGRSTHRRCKVGSTAAAQEQAPYRSGRPSPRRHFLGEEPFGDPRAGDWSVAPDLWPCSISYPRPTHSFPIGAHRYPPRKPNRAGAIGFTLAGP